LEQLLRDACRQVLGQEIKFKTENEIGTSLFRHQGRTGLIDAAADVSAISNTRYNLIMEGQREKPIPVRTEGYANRWKLFKENETKG
jgi:hypothetical protein